MKKKTRDIDLGFVAEALPSFINEATEQVEQIEQLLLQLEEDPGDRDKLDALFRCAHTVKGSAGIFGLDRVVAFTHDVETLLDRLREGRIDLDLQASTLLLQCNDQIRLLVTQAADAQSETDEQLAYRHELTRRLQALLGAPAEAAPPAADAAPTGAPAVPRWHLSATFGPDTFRNGMDPLSVLSYLDTLGEVHAIRCDVEAVPPLDRIDPESCHGAFQFSFDSEASREEIEAAFTFVRDDCTVRLIAPGAPVSHFRALIEAMPDQPRVGEILVAIGAISRAQLDAGLAEQEAVRAVAPGAVPRLGDLLQASTGIDPEVISAAVSKQQAEVRKPVRESRAAEPAGHAGDEHRYIRVQADRLDAVINLLGELVTAGAGAAMLSRQTRQTSLVEAHVHMGRLIEEIRNGTLQLRMVPIGETFSRFRRVVRDTAAQLGKEVALEILGGETELDKSMVERIVDPLMHLVRNSLDHGLENAEERVAAGKSGTGTLMLSARHESGTILISIEDDGRGISRERVLQRAWQRGLVEPGVTPSDAEILNLIFAPGFSTAEQVTNLSGRGVGMDVVKRNIEALRGSVTVHSLPGRGTQILIRLPLTLAIIDGFLVSSAQSRFVLPLASVIEVIEGRRECVDRMDRLDDGDTLDSGRRCVELRGEMLPVIDLRTLYDLEAPPAELPSIVVVKGHSGPFGIAVDALMGQHQTVIKPLGPIFRSLRGISGSSILGNGEVALILDVQSLGQLAERTPPPPPPASGRRRGARTDTATANATVNANANATPTDTDTARTNLEGQTP
ncbi:chemotaxis protein CheA [Leptothrix discophora]|uniref:Chemotaxis protein CheA n=1 Tax=Leptothrix discophora TaxID=89 RepID=A0ABT9G0I6_LEPDI|nr:chemotaxis protein CheA [Leptothrix discophora]MDP4299978.1 chemotaxis protein CheA [Leptothrix discophora]